ncbi:hypothetical protein E1218_29800 [Kribbella turkmenica]|uniref:Uncharacterized protein n=1 Tax=Kribbella turkmenica TaxID=2530375 RepID=A0A4R4WC88_9ACTN|nr:hypothetical protein [Kribbella turkmenica]TDD16422.1 hypothetical protein E1218_29800 [Kribbella turkmenica]
MAGRTKELDRWARVLRAGNDTEALAEIVPLRQRLVDSAARVLWIDRSLRRCPDGDLRVATRQAVQEAVNLWSEVAVVARKFEL